MATPKPLLSAENLALTNKKIAELKKKVQLAEGQKKAYTEEWAEARKSQNDKIAELKKEVRDLTNKLSYLHNPNSAKAQKNVQEIKRRVQLPPGAKTVKDALHIVDLKIIDVNKQADAIEAKHKKRELYYKKLLDQYHMLMGYKHSNADGSNPPETVEEDANRKLITHLENEIHRTSVQWMEAEHIRRIQGIKLALMRDAEKFESSLLDLEQAITEQQAEITKLEAVHKEAMQMRDNTKSILQRQEQTTHFANKAREKQALDFRRQVEERKQELERLERKIFSTGKTMVHQESVLSASGDHSAGKGEGDDSSGHDKETASEMEQKFKKLMQATGVSAASEVVDRFLAQREASARLTYLRTVTENEKKQLESQRELMTAQLDAFKFADVKDSDVNQEELEKIRNSIEEQKARREECEKAIDYTRNVFNTIKDSLVELLLALREIDDNLEVQFLTRTPTVPSEKPLDLDDISSENISTDDLGNMLEEKIKLGMIASGQLATETDSGLSEEETEQQPSLPPRPSSSALQIPTASPSVGTSSIQEDREKPPAYPPVYVNLIAGRTTAQISSASPGPGATVVLSDDEAEVPSRSYLKRQANMIIEAKSRRKGFRMPPPKRR
ncbi:AAEL010214-PA [Aedes aegypti]|uniref:AAEL010214-PA n=1 Tax=Aedes aegypti TaxID=7159 RepID=Q16TK8_AEDAE|nr:AAEL010214-PA [Aedes aegypti]